MEDSRQRDQFADGVFLTSDVFATGDFEADRQAAIDWGTSCYYDDKVKTPFKPYLVGPKAIGFWPADTSSSGLAVFNAAKGNLPADVDLDYGVTVNNSEADDDSQFYGIKVIELGDGSGGIGFVAVISGRAYFANKVADSMPE